MPPLVGATGPWIAPAARMSEDHRPDKPEAADMNPRHPLHLRHPLAIGAVIALLTLAWAPAGAVQYQWRDTQGRMVYSDLPPPVSVAPDRIIRAPQLPRVAASPLPPGTAQVATSATSAGSAASAGSAGSAGAGEAGLSNAEREMGWRKRLADKAAEEKKAAEAARRKLELARACSDAQGDIRSLESGQRISRINAAGEREFISDAERSQRLASARKNVGERC
jgi:hypothetical protein